MIRPTLDGTGVATGAVRQVPCRRCGRDPHRETFGAGGRAFPDPPVAERVTDLDPDFEASEGGPDR